MNMAIGSFFLITCLLIQEMMIFSEKSKVWCACDDVMLVVQGKGGTLQPVS